MPPSDKTSPSIGSFNAPTVVAKNTYAAKAAGERTLEEEPTAPNPVAPAGKNPLSEVMALIGERRPDLVEALLNIDRTYRQQAEAALKAQVTRQQQQLDDLFKKVEILVKTSRQVADQAVAAGLETQTVAIDTLLDRIDQQAGQASAMTDRLDRLLAEAQKTGHDNLEEAKSTNRSYKELLTKSSEERDTLSRQLHSAREAAAAETQRQTQAFAELQRLLDQEKRDSREQMVRAQERAAELEGQINEALASRDKIAARVKEVETKLESVIIPLRQELETRRASEAQIKIQLEAARKEADTLRVMAPPPRHRG